jgi:hypothetical protein
MMDIDVILDALIQKTEERKLNWAASAENEEFIASVGRISVAIRQLDRDVINFGERHRFTIFNAEGDVADILETADVFGVGATDTRATTTQASKLLRLYIAALRSSRGAQDVFEELAQGLESI